MKLSTILLILGWIIMPFSFYLDIKNYQHNLPYWIIWSIAILSFSISIILQWYEHKHQSRVIEVK